MEYNPFIESKLASHNELSGLMWCKFSHVPRGFPRENKNTDNQSKEEEYGGKGADLATSWLIALENGPEYGELTGNLPSIFHLKNVF